MLLAPWSLARVASPDAMAGTASRASCAVSMGRGRTTLRASLSRAMAPLVYLFTFSQATAHPASRAGIRVHQSAILCLDSICMAFGPAKRASSSETASVESAQLRSVPPSLESASRMMATIRLLRLRGTTGASVQTITTTVQGARGPTSIARTLLPARRSTKDLSAFQAMPTALGTSATAQPVTTIRSLLLQALLVRTVTLTSSSSQSGSGRVSHQRQQAYFQCSGWSVASSKVWISELLVTMMTATPGRRSTWNTAKMLLGWGAC